MNLLLYAEYAVGVLAHLQQRVGYTAAGPCGGWVG
jgi:hypothetical protein